MSNFNDYVIRDCTATNSISYSPNSISYLNVPPIQPDGKISITVPSLSTFSESLNSALSVDTPAKLNTSKKTIKTDKDSKTLIDRKDRKTKFIRVKYLKNTEEEEEKEITSEKTFPNIADIETYNNKAMKMTFSDGSFTRCAINSKDSAEDLFFYNAATICYLKKLLDDGSNTSGTNVYNKFLEIFSKVVKEVEKEKNKEKEKEAERKRKIKNKQKKKSCKNRRLLETLKKELKDVK